MFAPEQLSFPLSSLAIAANVARREPCQIFSDDDACYLEYPLLKAIIVGPSISG